MTSFCTTTPDVTEFIIQQLVHDKNNKFHNQYCLYGRLTALHEIEKIDAWNFLNCNLKKSTDQVLVTVGGKGSWFLEETSVSEATETWNGEAERNLRRE